MKAIMVMFDSLNRHMLPSWGCDWVHAPNFSRLDSRTIVFDNAYVGSMPCMPARRELHTGRLNFLHRSWGPLEPYDDSVPEILWEHGVYSHLVTDHWHYFQEGGANYHTRFKSWEFARGLEGDPWKGHVKDPVIPPVHPSQLSVPGLSKTRQDWVNRSYVRDVSDLSQHNVFESGMDFLRRNAGEDNWYLQLECFDPHEPFTPVQKHRDLYPHDYDGPVYDWPRYHDGVRETPEEIEHIRMLYAARVSQCDEYLGKVLDLMDDLDMWNDTMLIVMTDHGYLLGEHNWWAKLSMPWYNELAHIPLYVWDPRHGRRNVRSDVLVQTPDIAPTLLDFFGVAPTENMTGAVLSGTFARDEAVHDSILFGHFGSYVNIYDGRYVYMRGLANPDNSPLYEYTLMPAKLARSFPVEDLQDIQLVEPFGFTKGCRLMKLPGKPQHGTHTVQHQWTNNLLFDNQQDHAQAHPLQDDALERSMIEKLVHTMIEHEAPPEQFERLGLQEYYRTVSR